MVVSMIFWGGSWTSAKLVSTSAPAQVLIFWRFLATFISFVPLVFILRIPLKLNLKGIFQVLAGSLFLIVYNLLFFNGVAVGLAGAGGVMVTTLNPIITFFFTALIFRQKFGTKHIIGLVIGLLGGGILLEIWKLNSGQLLKGGNLYFLFAAAMWALLSITSQNSKANMNPFAFSFYTYGITAFAGLFLSLPLDVFNIQTLKMDFWLNILYISVGATTFATTAYFFAASNLGANRASSFIFLVPTSAMLISWWLLGEEPKFFTIVGGVMALMAVYIINSKQGEKKAINSETEKEVKVKI